MTKKGVAAYRRANPGSKLKTAVTGNPAKGSKDAKRRKSFCATKCRADEKVSKGSEESQQQTASSTAQMEVLTWLKR